MNFAQGLLNSIQTGFRIDKRKEIETESTQNPALEPGKRSPGLAYSFENPIPTSFQDTTDPLTMIPVNASHWTRFLNKHSEANAFLKGSTIQRGTPNPVDLLAAIQEPQEEITAGSLNIWRHFYNMNQVMGKGYNPLQSLY
jgi:hypothetical protein